MDGGTGSADDPVVVVGLGCRLPGGVDSPEALWRLVEEGRDVIGSAACRPEWETPRTALIRAAEQLHAEYPDAPEAHSLRVAGQAALAHPGQNLMDFHRPGHGIRSCAPVGPFGGVSLG